jgi:hypothetical protein
MRRAALISSVVCGCCLYGGGLALAGGGAATDAYEGLGEPGAVATHALADLYVMENFNHPASGLNQLRAFDFRDRPSIGYLRGTLAVVPRTAGFRLDVGAGNTADVFEQQDPAAAQHPSWARATSHLGQAFVTLVLPLTRPIALEVGKFATPMGLEDNESLPNWSYSRSLLYSWAEPTLHTGLRATSQLAPTLALSLFWVNGWDANVLDGSGMRTFAGAVTWKPRDEIEVAAADMIGLEHPPAQLGAPLSLRNLLNASVVVEPWAGISFALSADVGDDRAGGGVNWWGVAWYARLALSGWAAAALRGEVLSDPDGFVTGTRQSVAALTTTAEARGRIGRLLVVGRLEYRHDQSDAPVFESATPASRTHQDTVTIALISAF